MTPKQAASLRALVTVIGADRNLDLQIRDGYINVYYCGGCIWKIDGFSSGLDEEWVSFNRRYLKGWWGGDSKLPKENDGDLSKWIASLGELKQAMGNYFLKKPNYERKVQQELCAMYSRVPDSPWVILDMEYAAWIHGAKHEKGGPGRRLCKFDFVAFERVKPEKLYLVELKVTRSAMGGLSGIRSHAEDFAHLLTRDSDIPARQAFKESMRNILRDKVELGLLPNVSAKDILANPTWPEDLRVLFSLGGESAAWLNAHPDAKAYSEKQLEAVCADHLWCDENLEPLPGA